MGEDLTARVAELASAIEANLTEDEAAAEATAPPDRRSWRTDEQPGDDDETVVGWRVATGRNGAFVAQVWGVGRWAGDRTADHIARHDPARALRRVKATRELVAVILGEQHYSADVGYYSCSQAQEWAGLIGGPTGPPGSGCSDPERAGKPCDCGRDARVARMLGIIASEWESGTDD